MKHSYIGASSAHRWFECPGSVRLMEEAPPDQPSIYAQQGTAAHWAIEQTYAKDWDGRKLEDVVRSFVDIVAPNGYQLTEEDVESAAQFVELIEAERQKGKYLLHSEAKFNLTRIYEGLFGTADLVLMESNMKRLKVYDYKHGSGMPVEVVDNKQLMYYALGAVEYVCTTHGVDYLETMDYGEIFSEVEIVIVQPRCRHKEGTVRSWIVPGAALSAFAKELKVRAEATAKPDAPLVAGLHCRYCRAMPICPAMNSRAFELAKTDFAAVSSPANLNLPAPEALTTPEIVKILNFSDIISEFLRAVEAHAQSLLEHGQEVPGYKLVAKRSNRQWINEAEALETLSLVASEADLYEKKFLSPAKAEKLLGKTKKKMVEDLTVKPEAGNTIAPEYDPREPVKGSVTTDFADDLTK